MKLGSKLASDVRAVAKSLSVLADTFEGMTPKQEQPTEPVAATPREARPQTKALTLVEVRTALMPIARSGKSDAIRELLLKHGANSLTELDPAKYAALLSEAEAL
jgi:hypothetical protein